MAEAKSIQIQKESKSTHNFEQCLKCSICTVYCPVSAVEPNYPGPKQSGPDNERYRLEGGTVLRRETEIVPQLQALRGGLPGERQDSRPHTGGAHQI